MAGTKSYYNCSVSNCLNSTINSDYAFFSLPVDSARRATWLKLINREDLNDATFKRARVCEAHFSPSDLVVNSVRKLLRRNTIPELLLPQPWRDNVENKATQTDLRIKSEFGPNDEVQDPLDIPKDTSRKRKLSSEIVIENKRLKKSGDSLSKAFNKLCDQFLSKNLASIVKQQAKLKSHSSDDMFKLEFKLFCLNLYHVSPRAYNLLRDTLCLPSKQSLIKMHMPVTTKIDNHLMEVLATNIQHMSVMDRNCSLVVDLISLKANLFYNIKEDRLYGFRDVDGVQSPEPAKYALVAMINGLFGNYKQPVGYALLSEYKNSQTVSEWINRLIQKLFSIGLHVRTLVTDMGTHYFNSAKNKHNEDRKSVSPEMPFFFVDGKKIYHIFDAPYLIKLLRNNLRINEFHFENSVAKWDHIIQFYEMDKLKRLRLARKLTESHVKPTDSEKIKVKYAVETFNVTVAAGMSMYKDFGLIESTAEGTIKLIEMISELSQYLKTQPRYKIIQYQNGDQTTFLNKMLDFFASLKLINTNGQNVTSKEKFIEGFQITLQSLLLLVEDLKLEGYSTYKLTRPLNYDCLKDVFGKFITKNGRISKPTSWQLVLAYRKHFFTNLIKTLKGINCTEDLARSLLKAKKFNAGSIQIKQELIEETSEQSEDFIIIEIPPIYNEETGNSTTVTSIPQISVADYNMIDLPEKKKLIFISGFLLTKCLKHHKCPLFKAYTKGQESGNFLQDIKFSRFQEYCKDGSKRFLASPQDSFIQFVELMEDRFCNFLRINYLNRHILKSLLCEIKPLTFPLPCKCFPIDYCKKLFLRIRIYHTLKYNNRVLRQCTRRKHYFDPNLQDK